MEEENAQLRIELASLREELAKAHDVMTALLAAQEQPVRLLQRPLSPFQQHLLMTALLCRGDTHTDSHLSLLLIPQQVLLVLPMVTKSPSQGMPLSTLLCLSQRSSLTQ